MDSVAAQRAAAAFESMLLKDLLAPLARGADSLGDYGTGALARTIAEHDARGFGALLAQALERRVS